MPIVEIHRFADGLISISTSSTNTKALIDLSAPKEAAVILVTGHIDFDPTRRGEFLAALEPLTKGSMADPGCVQYTFGADFENPGRVHVLEQWESDELMQAHMATPHCAEFGKVMRSIGVRALKVTKHEVASSEPLFGD